MEETNLKLEALKHRNYDMYRYFKRGLEIISALKSKMYEAYIVGGAARDFILNIDFNDIDIATNATPEDVKAIFSNLEIDDRYSHLGAVTIKENGFNYEITTFRNEEYVKCKIKNIHYSKKLVEDIIRRDFTINALAITPNLTIVDLVDGQHDLERKVVKVIGSGKRRFKDDPTRIFRGLQLVAKFGFSLDSNTEKAMRKSKVYLKELSDYRIITSMKKILSEKYGLKALKAIDDNNLFKFLPNYSYWVRLMIRNYRKLELIEKITLFYRIIGNVQDNNGHTKEEYVKIKKLFELSQHITVNPVDSMMVFTIGTESLLSADRICKAYNHKYRKQKRIIKKIDKRLVIRDEKELEISSLELVEIVNGDNTKISYIMTELLSLVINGDIDNKNLVLKEYAYKILSGQYPKPYKKTTNTEEKEKTSKKSFKKLFGSKTKQDDKDFDDEDEEQKLYSKIYEGYTEETSIDFDAWDQVPIDETYDDTSSIDKIPLTANEVDASIGQLKNEYEDDFKQLYNIYIKGIKNYNQMSKTEKEMKEIEIKVQVKTFLLSTNPKYQLLEERKLI